MFKGNAYYSFLLFPALLLMFSGCEAPVQTGPEGMLEMTEQDYQKWLGHTSDEESPIVLGDILLVYHEEGSDVNGIFWVNPGVGRDPVVADVTVPGSIRPRELEDVIVVTRTLDQVKTELEGFTSFPQQRNLKKLSKKRMASAVMLTRRSSACSAK